MQQFQPTGGNDTAALQAAIAGATSLEILAGNSQITAPIVVDHECEIIWRSGARLLAAHASNDVLRITGSWVRLINPRIEAAVLRTGGAYVRLVAGMAHRFRSVGGHFSGHAIGFAVENNATVDIDDLTALAAVPAIGESIRVTGGLDLHIRRLTSDNDPTFKSLAAVRVLECGDLELASCSLMSSETGLMVDPAAGKTVASLWAHDTYFDRNGVRGVYLNSNAGGAILRSRFSDCWASSNAQQGILSHATAGEINGVDISGLHGFGNGLHAVHLEGIGNKNFGILGGQMAGNLVGVAIGASINGFGISAVRARPSAGFGSNTWGIYLAGSNDRYIILGNHLDGNSAGAITGHVAGINRIMVNNLT